MTYPSKRINQFIFKLLISSILFFSSLVEIQAQHVHNEPEEIVLEDEHHQGIRIAGLIGHTLIKSEGVNSHIIVPSWGLDIEYWFNHKWGIGLHNDIEIESFIIETTNEQELERNNPLVLTLDVLYHLNSGWVFSFGPGVEIEHEESFYLCRFGIEYEKEIGHGWDIVPTIFYDQRIGGFATYTFALGLGKRF